MKLIITCGCGDTTQFAKDAFKVWFPKDKYDNLIEKPDNDFLEVVNNYLALYANKRIDFSKPYALLLNSGKYNKVINFTDIEIYDLLKGYKIC